MNETLTVSVESVRPVVLEPATWTLVGSVIEVNSCVAFEVTIPSKATPTLRPVARERLLILFVV